MSGGKAAIEAALRLYSGEGIPVSQRNQRLPLFERPSRLDAPEYYVAEKALADAVNVALVLGQPLLVTGDPGTGKTQLAASVASELELPPPLTFMPRPRQRRKICSIVMMRWGIFTTRTSARRDWRFSPT